MRLIIIISLFSFLFADVRQQIINFYKSHYPTIQIISVKSNIPLPKHYKKISFKLANFKMPSSTIKIDNKYYFITIKAKIGVYVANKVIMVNEPILPNVTFKLINFRNFYSPPLYKISPDLIASKVISINSVINKNNTKIRPLILKGQDVSVIFEDKNIEIYAKGTALNDADENETVKVKIGGKIYTGTADKNQNVIIH